MKMFATIIAIMLSSGALFTGLPIVQIESFGTEVSQEDWKREFDNICSKTQDALEFSVGELRDLIARCDALKPRIEKLDEPQRKVTLKRLQMCRDFYVYLLEGKENQ
ncbi:MAG TPA: hypothetical protein VK551_04350 [Thermodesulfobacteriota bacterium]|nr:hypothetical protein [Thermodesulfobacteriota bacterium]